jgi:hypothetical protein
LHAPTTAELAARRGSSFTRGYAGIYWAASPSSRRSDLSSANLLDFLQLLGRKHQFRKEPSNLVVSSASITGSGFSRASCTLHIVGFSLSAECSRSTHQIAAMPDGKIRALCAQIALELDPDKADTLIALLRRLLNTEYSAVTSTLNQNRQPNDSSPDQ